MAIQYVGHYVASCVRCGWIGPPCKRRGEAAQVELDHHRVLDKGACRCPILNDHQHHYSACSPSHQRAVVLPSGTASTGGIS